MAHRTIEPKIFYVGTPVVLISTRNPDGSANLAPMSSAWWLGSSCMLGLSARSQTAENLRRERQGVLNLVQSELVGAVDAIALLTGVRDVPAYKVERGYRYEPRKFEAAGLTAVASDIVDAPRALECQIQLEVVIDGVHTFADPDDALLAFEARVVRSHVDDSVIVDGSDRYIDPERWDPLIMKFCEFYGEGVNIATSQLASGWRMPPLRSGDRQPVAV